MQGEEHYLALVATVGCTTSPHILTVAHFIHRHSNQTAVIVTAVIVILLASVQTSRLASQRLFAPSEKENV